MQKIIILSFFLMLLAGQTSVAQSIAIRAGLNFYKFSGPTEPGEVFDYSTGIHFGVGYGYKFTNDFLIRAELLYTQNGSKTSYDGPGFYVIHHPTGTIYEKGRSTISLNISNAYVCLPITANYMLSKKWEIVAGLSPNFLVNPTAQGTLRFESTDNPENVFRQSLDYRYYSDAARQGAFQGRPVAIFVNGSRFDLPRLAGAYYQNTEKRGNRFKFFDLSTVFGLNYYFNKGFYTGVRVEYGITDITNNRMDFSYQGFNSDNTLIQTNDYDHQFGLQVSIGFRF